MRKKLLFLFALLLSLTGLTGKAQVVFQTSTAPGDSDWAEGTHWYRLRCNSTFWISTGSSYVDASENLKSNIEMKDLTDNGLWCLVGDDTNGYTFYNKASGVTKVLGMTGSEASARAKMYTADEANTASATTKFFKVASSKFTNGYCFRMASSGNNYWNNRSYLALWDNSGATSDNGSAFTFFEEAAAPTTLFTYVASVDNITEASWQALTSRSTTNSKYYWNLADDGTTITTSAYTGGMDEFPETAQWAFIGDAENGFKIYNRSKQKYVKAERNASSTNKQYATLADEGSTFYAYDYLGNQPENGFMLTSEKGSLYFLNQADSKLLISWAANTETGAKTDAGNAIVAVSAKDLIEAAQNANWSSYTALNTSWQSMQANVLTNAVGYPTDADKTSMNTACTNKSNYATAKSLYAQYTTVADGYYRLVNAQKQTAEGTTMYLTPEVSGTNLYLYKKSGTEKNVDNVVKITTNSSGQRLLWVNGKTISTNPGRSNGAGRRFSLVDEASAGKFIITSANLTGLFAIGEQTNKDSNYNCIHSNGNDGTQVVNWSYSSSADNASLWYIVPATDVEVSLNALDDKSYATAYLPFDATISSESNVKAYTAALNEAYTAFNLTEVTTLPSATGLLLVDETSAAATATLHISTETEKTSATSELTGTYFPITLTDAQKEQYLVFGKSNNVAGFYYPGTNLATIGMNKAYYDNSTNSAGNSIGLVWNSVTGINAAESAIAPSAAPVFDLSGRRVTAPVKGGIYIQAGKKFVK